MKRFKLFLAVVFLGAIIASLAGTSVAYPPFVARAKKFGAKDCTFCHVNADGGPPWNARGKWLIKQKEERKADEVDVNWLADYKPGADGGAFAATSDPGNETPTTPPAVQAATTTAPSSPDQEFLKLEQDWMGAVGKHDQDSLRKLTADEFTLTSAYSTGDLSNKADFLKNAAEVNGLEFTYHDFAVHTYGDLAVVKTRLKSSYTAGGQERGGDFLITDVWVKKEGQWQMMTRHSSLPAVPKE
ncbi:MAG: DUF4440 domain-containing protein [Blastocatellia bacterium]